VQVGPIIRERTVSHPDGSINALARYWFSSKLNLFFLTSPLSKHASKRIKKQLMKMQDELAKRELPVLEKCKQILR